MAYTPLKHQIEDSDALLEYSHGYLWADPGTGKTITAMEAVRKGDYDKIVVVCPRIALDMWLQELQTHLGYARHDIAVARGGPVHHKLPRNSKPWAARKVFITTTDLAGKHRKFIGPFCRGYNKVAPKDHVRPRSVLIIDEAHKFKSVTAGRSLQVMGSGDKGLDGLQRLFDDVWQLTGTPITRHADDLYNQLKIGRHEILRAYKVGSYDAFVNEFCRVEWKSYHHAMRDKKTVVGTKNMAKLERLLDDCKVIRRKLEEVWDEMPDISYRSFTADYKDVPDAIVDQATLLRELNQPDSMMSKIYRKLGVAKAGGVVQFLLDKEAVPHRPVLVGCWHRDVIDHIADALYDKGHKVRVIHGGTSDANRLEAQNLFNAGEIDFLVGQVKAMGEAISLQERGSHVVLAEQLASPSDLKQFVARVMRRGQKNHVQVDIASSGHDLDEALIGLRNMKASNIERVI